MIFQQILNKDSGLSTRAKLNSMLSALIQSDEGVNALWVFLKSLEQAMQTLSSKEANDVAALRDSLSGANDYTDKAVNKLYTYVDAMNGGVGGLIDSTSYDPSGLLTDKSCTLIALGAGTFTNLKDVTGTAITVSQSNSITVFFRAAHVTYWNYKTEVITLPPIDNVPTANSENLITSGAAFGIGANIAFYDLTLSPAVYPANVGAIELAKTITITGFKLMSGGCIRIKFPYNNTALQPTLNISGTGAKPLYYNGKRVSSANTWKANEIVEFYYDGTNWQGKEAISNFKTINSQSLLGEGNIRINDFYYIEWGEDAEEAINVLSSTNRQVVCIYTILSPTLQETSIKMFAHSFNTSTGKIDFSGVVGNTLYYCSVTSAIQWDAVQTLDLSAEEQETYRMTYGSTGNIWNEVNAFEAGKYVTVVPNIPDATFNIPVCIAYKKVALGLGSSAMYFYAIVNDGYVDRYIDVQVRYLTNISQQTSTVTGWNVNTRILTNTEIFDVTEFNGGDTYASLAAILDSTDIDEIIPVALRKGGMSIKFVLNFNNKYVQYRLLTGTFSTNVVDWEIVGNVTKEDLATKQDLLQSGVNIKTINGTPILGSGNIDAGKTYIVQYGNISGITTTIQNYLRGFIVVCGYVSQDYNSTISLFATKFDESTGVLYFNGILDNKLYQCSLDAQNGIWSAISTINITDSGTVIVTTTNTYSEVLNAYNVGENIVLRIVIKDDILYLPITGKSDTSIVFSGVYYDFVLSTEVTQSGWTTLQEYSMSSKVDKVQGKGLSTNDYTNEEKTKLAALNNYDDTQVRQLIAQTNVNFANYYTKSESYSANEVDTLLRTQRQGQYVVVTTLPTASADTMFKIYIVPSTDPQTSNIKDEYVTLEDNGSYSWEKIGTTAVDLSNYSTTAEMNAAIATALNSYYTKSELNTALGNKQDTISDLATIRSGASAGSTAYQKPNTGIPSTDMSQAVQTSLSKADSAIQQHQDISGKQDKQIFSVIDTSQQTSGATLTVGTDYVVNGTINSYNFILSNSPTNGIINIIFNTGDTPNITFTALNLFAQEDLLLDIEPYSCYEMSIKACNGNYYAVGVKMETLM